MSATVRPGTAQGRGRPTWAERAWGRVRDVAAARAGRSAPPPPVQAAPPAMVMEFLRRLGVAMCDAGDATNRISLILEEVAAAYGAESVRFFVVPTGVFVRIESGSTSGADFASGTGRSLRLDQIDLLYRLVDDVTHGRVAPEQALRRLSDVLATRARFGPVWTIVASGVLTIGLGLMLNPSLAALPAYFVVGLVVGALRWTAERALPLRLILPVAAAFTVTWASFRYAATLFGAQPLDIVIPALVTFLPGAALTMATVELSSGSIMSGSARLVFGLERLLLLAFGIITGAQVAGTARTPDSPSASLGAWAPWLGVLVFGLGQFVHSSAPARTLRWLLVVLYVAYAAQALSGPYVGAVGSSFLAGVVVPVVAFVVQGRRSGPPAMVTFLPAFWLLVPGSLGLVGVTEIVGASAGAGLADFLDALLTIVAIALGVLVGASLLQRPGRGNGL